MFGKFLVRIRGLLHGSPAHRKSLSHVVHILGVRDDGNGALDPSALNRETPTVAGTLPEAPPGILSITPINTHPADRKTSKHNPDHLTPLPPWLPCAHKITPDLQGPP